MDGGQGVRRMTEHLRDHYLDAGTRRPVLPALVGKPEVWKLSSRIVTASLREKSMRSAHPLQTLSQEEEQALQCMVKATSERVDVVKRAKAILAVHAGKPYTQAARRRATRAETA